MVLVHGSLFYYFLFLFFLFPPRLGFVLRGFSQHVPHAVAASSWAFCPLLLPSPQPLPGAVRPKPSGGRGQDPDPAAALTPRGGEAPKGGRNGAAVPSEPVPALFCWVLGRNRRFLGREQPPAAVAAFYFPLLGGCSGVGGGRCLKNNQQNPLFCEIETLYAQFWFFFFVYFFYLSVVRPAPSGGHREGVGASGSWLRPLPLPLGGLGPGPRPPPPPLSPCPSGKWPPNQPFSPQIASPPCSRVQARVRTLVTTLVGFWFDFLKGKRRKK